MRIRMVLHFNTACQFMQCSIIVSVISGISPVQAPKWVLLNLFVGPFVCHAVSFSVCTMKYKASLLGLPMLLGESKTWQGITVCPISDDCENLFCILLVQYYCFFVMWVLSFSEVFFKLFCVMWILSFSNVFKWKSNLIGLNMLSLARSCTS